MSESGEGRVTASALTEDGRLVKSEVLNVRAMAKRERTPMERALDRTAAAISHPLFFVSEALFHLGWVLANTGVLPGITPWDPFPFGFLGGLASVQALFIALLILMQARHESTASEVREEMDLQVALHAEREISKVMRMLAEVHRSLGVQSDEHDEELEVMSEPIQPDYLMNRTEERLEEAEEEEE